MITTNAQSLANELRLVIPRDLSPKTMSRELARFARDDINKRISSGEFPSSYRRYVNGIEGESEDNVRPDGSIVYEANLLPPIVRFALGAAVGLSPRLSGEYQHSWVIFVDGQLWISPIEDIPVYAQVWITNFTPYHRKIDVGAMKMQVPPGIIESARQLVYKRFGKDSVVANRIFITIPGGYVLKRPPKTGEVMTYPTLELRLN